MNRRIIESLIIWLRRKHPGTVVKMRDFWIYYISMLFGIMPLSAMLSIKVFRKDGSVEDLGIVSTHQITNAFVNYLTDSLQGTQADWINFKYHDSGTGTNVEAVADTALQTPCGEARDIGTQVEGATANMYKSVAIHTYAGDFTITEHGLFNATAAGTLMDRSVFAGIGVAPGDKIEFSYQLTCTAGG